MNYKKRKEKEKFICLQINYCNANEIDFNAHRIHIFSSIKIVKSSAQVGE